MQLIPIKGNTYVLEDWQYIPLYMVDAHRCILLDTGDLSQRHAIEETLSAHGLTPVGILGTHVHTDHSPNHRYFQEKYRIPVALSAGEAGLCVTQLNLKAYFFMLPIGQINSEDEVRDMELVADRVILPGETELEFCGVRFGTLRTPGHSPDHICIRTPDDVLYLGDAVLTGDSLTSAKLPYFFSHRDAIASMDLLRREKASLYLAAHKGVYEDITPWLDANQAAIRDRSTQIAALVDRPMTIDEIYAAACRRFSLLTSKYAKAALFERNLRTYVEYLRDAGALRVFARNGLNYYTSEPC